MTCKEPQVVRDVCQQCDTPSPCICESKQTLQLVYTMQLALLACFALCFVKFASVCGVTVREVTRAKWADLAMCLYHDDACWRAQKPYKQILRGSICLVECKCVNSCVKCSREQPPQKLQVGGEACAIVVQYTVTRYLCEQIDLAIGFYNVLLALLSCFAVYFVRFASVSCGWEAWVLQSHYFVYIHIHIN